MVIVSRIIKCMEAESCFIEIGYNNIMNARMM
jgi:hypothetical protein